MRFPEPLRELHGRSTLVPSLLWDPPLNAKSPTIGSLSLPQLVFGKYEDGKKHGVADTGMFSVSMSFLDLTQDESWDG